VKEASTDIEGIKDIIHELNQLKITTRSENVKSSNLCILIDTSLVEDPEVVLSIQRNEG
jgi:hypothetical protein